MKRSDWISQTFLYELNLVRRSNTEQEHFAWHFKKMASTTKIFNMCKTVGVLIRNGKYCFHTKDNELFCILVDRCVNWYNSFIKQLTVNQHTGNQSYRWFC